MEICGCPRDALCDRCVSATYAQLGGVAAARGWYWAERVWQVTQRRDAWTANALKARTRALQLVADLTVDRRLRERMVDRVIAEAVRRWEMLTTPVEIKPLPFR